MSQSMKNPFHSVFTFPVIDYILYKWKVYEINCALELVKITKLFQVVNYNIYFHKEEREVTFLFIYFFAQLHIIHLYRPIIKSVNLRAMCFQSICLHAAFEIIVFWSQILMVYIDLNAEIELFCIELFYIILNPFYAAKVFFIEMLLYYLYNISSGNILLSINMFNVVKDWLSIYILVSISLIILVKCKI